MAGDNGGVWPRASAVGLGLLVVAQLAVGFYLNSVYSPTPELAHDSVVVLREDPLRSVLQNFHYWGSAWLILHGFLHLLLLVLTGGYLRISKWAWLGSVLVFGSAFLMQVTGNLLPFDRHDVQTAVIEGGIAAQMPFVGDIASSMLLGGEEFGAHTLAAWHKVHFWLLVPAAIGGLLCLFGFPRPTARAKGFAPWLWLVPLLAVATLAGLADAPYGQAATEADYSAFDARPSWYTWGMHGALNAFGDLAPGLTWVGSALLPALFGLLLLLAPWLGAKKDRLVRGLLVLFVIGFGVMGALKGGVPAPAWGAQEVAEADPPADASEADAPIDEAMAKRGLDLAKIHCAPCHGADLTGGAVPDLTKMHERRIAPQWYIDFLKDPKAVKPTSTMAASFKHLSDEQLAELAEWLRQPK